MISENIKYITMMACIIILISLATGSVLGEDIKPDLSITYWSPPNDPITTVGIPQIFSIDLNKKADVVWTIDNSAVQSYSNVHTSSYTDYTADIGIHNVNVLATDGGGDFVTKDWIWTVEYEPPQIIYIPPAPIITYVTGNFWIDYTVRPNIESGTNKTDSLSVSLDDGMTWQDGISPNTNFNITVGPHGQSSILAFAYNNSGGISQTVSENVQLDNNIPVQNGIGDKTVTVGQTLTFTVYAIDADGDTITYNTSATKGLYNSSIGIYSWVPNSSDVGTYTWLFCSNDNYGGSSCETVTIIVNTNNGGSGGNGDNNGGNNGGNSGGSSSGGTGGGTSGENYYNIEFKKRQELDIYKDVVTSYVFVDKIGPIMFVNITGNSNTGEVTGIMEVLKNRSSLLKTSAPGFIYKNINIWIGTSSFATPKNIKFPAKITFRIENSWIDKNSVIRENIKMVRWDGKKWITLDTSGKMKDSNYTYFDANTDGFTHFAIIDSKNIKGEKSTYTVPTYTTEKPKTNQSDKPKVRQTVTMTPNPKKTPGFEVIIGMAVFLIICIIQRKKR